MERVYQSPTRNRIVVGGRRIGKTEFLLAECIKALRPPQQSVWYICPTYKMAKAIFWERIKQVIPRGHMARAPHETDLKIWLKNGSTLELKGADNPDSLRGVGVNQFLLDELDFWDKPETAYGAVLRPMLVTTRGGMVAVGSPNGFRLLKDFYDRGQNGVPNWESWLFKTRDFVAPLGHIDPAEFEEAKRDMDERTYLQEWEANFLLATGRVAYNWSPANCNKEITYNPKEDVYVSLDFNVQPAAGILAHIDNNEIVQQFDEIHLSDAWTQLVIDKVADKLKNHEAKIRVYGDPAGTRRHSSSKETDWQIAEKTLRMKFGNRVSFLYSRGTIAEREKINCLNARICNAMGERRYFANPITCRETIKDFEQVKARPDGTIDKSDTARTHWFDAAGYLCVGKWPMGSRMVSSAHINI
jgi:hypothetical protein